MTQGEKRIGRKLATDGGKYLMNHTIPERSIDSIREKVVFIKINKFYQKYAQGKEDIDDKTIKNWVGGIWRIGENMRSILSNLKKNCYVFAIYRRKTFGVFRILRVSDEVGKEYRLGLHGFPGLPKTERRIDRQIAQFPSVEAAKSALEHSLFTTFLAELQERTTTTRMTENDVLVAWRKRVYFELDDTIPEELAQFKGCWLTKEGDAKFFKGRNPIRFNF